MKLAYQHIKPLIHAEKSFSKWIGYFGLGVGVFILLFSLQMFFNIRQLVHEEAPQKSGSYDFISISKTITNENMGKDNRFTEGDLEILRKQKQINAVAPLYANKFSATASAGNVLPFSTELFLESIDKSFLDTIPEGFDWQPGDMNVPVIFSSDFLEMYNIFAPSQGLPQLSPRTVSSVTLFLECSGTKGSHNFRANIAGLSDRFNSVLVPESFLKWANLNLSGDNTSPISRVYIKTTDTNNPDLLKFLETHQFHVNKDKLRFGRIKGVLQNITGAIGGFGILVILLAIILFGFYLRLMIARSSNNLHLLLTLGYSPSWLTSGFTKSFLPAYTIIIILATFLVAICQFLFSQFNFTKGALSSVPHWAVWLTAVVLLLLTIWANRRIVKSEIKKMA